MSELDFELLSLAYEQYRTTGNRVYSFIADDGDKWFNYTESMRNLLKQGFIYIQDKSILDSMHFDGNFDVFKYSFEITDLGISFLMENSK